MRSALHRVLSSNTKNHLARKRPLHSSRSISSSGKSSTSADGTDAQTPEPSTSHQVPAPAATLDSAFYHTSLHPTPDQLRSADAFFKSSKVAFLKRNSEFYQLPPSNLPEVAFIGRSNVGKSSLLNALTNRTTIQAAKVSKKPGRTTAMNAFAVGDVQAVPDRLKAAAWQQHKDKTKRGRNQEPLTVWKGHGLVILDMPGYGYNSRQEWGESIVKYLTKRKQLRRVFLLINALHGIKPVDRQMIDLLAQQRVPYQIILAKADTIMSSRLVSSSDSVNTQLELLRGHASQIRQQFAGQPVHQVGYWTDDWLFTSSTASFPPNSDKKIGIDHLRWAVLSVTGIESNPKTRKFSPHRMYAVTTLDSSSTQPIP